MRPQTSLLAFFSGLLAAPAVAAAPKVPDAAAEAQVLELSKQSIALRSVRGEGNKTIEVAKLYKAALMGAGWAEQDIEITGVDDTALFVATWQGTDPRLKPIVIAAHMDVVEAKPADWERDPFTPVVENGLLYGRGASDQKVSQVLALVALMELRKGGYKPRRTIVIAFSGDEETSMKTSRMLAERFAGAEMMLNTDGIGGSYDDATGRPLYWTWQGAEKSYLDVKLEVTNPGGHSSAPRRDNAITQLATALERIGNYTFKAEQSPLTKAYFEKAARFESDPKIAAAMRAFAANPDDAAALAVLRASPSHVGKVGTTCVPTMVSGGHAENALPQRATANVNCRIFPGHTRDAIIAELARVANVPTVKFTDFTGGDTTESPASPMRADFIAAVEKAMKLARPGVPVFPSQSSGATDAMWYRAQGVPSYTVSPLFIKDSDSYSHGLNERIPLSGIRPGLVYYFSLFPDLTK